MEILYGKEIVEQIVCLDKKIVKDAKVYCESLIMFMRNILISETLSKPSWKKNAEIKIYPLTRYFLFI